MQTLSEFLSEQKWKHTKIDTNEKRIFQRDLLFSDLLRSGCAYECTLVPCFRRSGGFGPVVVKRRDFSSKVWKTLCLFSPLETQCFLFYVFSEKGKVQAYKSRCSIVMRCHSSWKAGSWGLWTLGEISQWSDFAKNVWPAGTIFVFFLGLFKAFSRISLSLPAWKPLVKWSIRNL